MPRTRPLLWPLHRAHHSATYMSIRVTYRNNLFYYLLMPGLWFGGLALYLGFGAVYGIYLICKITIILGAHSAWRWDEPLYRIRALRPLMWLVQRTISTPSTHWAHHALTNADGIGHYKGNFGNMLFLWDMLFGTAHITQKYPAQVGLQDDQIYGKERWFHEMFYPLLQSKREHSALRAGGRAFAEAETTTDAGGLSQPVKACVIGGQFVRRSRVPALGQPMPNLATRWVSITRVASRSEAQSRLCVTARRPCRVVGGFAGHLRQH